MAKITCPIKSPNLESLPHKNVIVIFISEYTAQVKCISGVYSIKILSKKL